MKVCLTARSLIDNKPYIYDGNISPIIADIKENEGLFQ